MASVKKFEDLICWQKARELTKQIYKISQHINMSRDRGLCDQIQRASVSIMSNIAEGFERGTKLELINYFYIAKGSCAEVRCQLHIALDAEYIDISIFRHIYGLADETGRLIQSFIAKVKIKSLSGVQYKALKSREMPEYIKLLLKQQPEMEKYYNPERREIEWWRHDQDKQKI